MECVIEERGVEKERKGVMIYDKWRRKLFLRKKIKMMLGRDPSGW